MFVPGCAGTGGGGGGGSGPSCPTTLRRAAIARRRLIGGRGPRDLGQVTKRRPPRPPPLRQKLSVAPRNTIGPAPKKSCDGRYTLGFLGSRFGYRPFIGSDRPLGAPTRNGAFQAVRRTGSGT